MTIETLIPLILVFILGAMSPGPSLLLVTKNTITKGTRSGIYSALGHGIGFGLYCFTVMNLYKIIIQAFPNIVVVLQIGGIILLIYFSINFLIIRPSEKLSEKKNFLTLNRLSFIEGFLISIINPKILIWMIAIFSPFIDGKLPFYFIIIISFIGSFIDASWYLVVAILLGKNQKKISTLLNTQALNKIMGIVMLFFAAVLFFSII
tara:strand:+ start:18 stop:635 length:618 start_codon:yes stop_codon:yes gene_type:complete